MLHSSDETNDRAAVPRAAARGPIVLVALLAVVLLGANVLLLQQNRELKRQLAVSQSDRFPQVGDELPPLRGTTPEGEPTTVAYGEDPRRTLLLVFSPTCGWCEKNLPNWRAIVESIDRREFRPVAVATRSEGLDDLLAGEPLYRDLPVVADLDPSVEVAYKLNSTPLTLVVSPEGVVEEIWKGAFHQESERAAERYFDADLPGIPDLG